MKPILVAIISALIVGQAIGHYLPTDESDYYTQPCGCNGKLSDFEYNVDSPRSEELTDDDIKYKFNFEIEQPKASESQSDLKSYGYDIQTPPSEPMKDDTKYKFDYSLQKPAEEKSTETEPRTMYTKVDRVTQDKPDCSCKQGTPCACGYSREQCATQCNHQSSSPYNTGYVLPVRYDNGGDYSVYEFPQAGSPQQYLHRNTRQVLNLFSPPSSSPSSSSSSSSVRAADAIQSFINSDAVQQAATAIRQRVQQITAGRSDSGPTLGSALGSSSDRSAAREKFLSFADPIVARATQMVDDLRQNFAQTTRRRRDTDKRMPMLRVKEYESGRDKTENHSKFMSTTRVELKPSENQEKNLKEVEKATHCHSCGWKLMDSVCKRCGSYQPQYVEYIEGKPAAYYPGATPTKIDDYKPAEPRYIYDRYGHKYLENNGNLRLIAPQYQEAVVSDQPDFAGLADILNQNREVIDQMNKAPGRLTPQPIDIASDTIDLIRDLARRDTKTNENEDEKRSSKDRQRREYEENSEYRMTTDEKKDEWKSPRSMYQVVPMRYEGKDGKLVVKVYSAKNDKTKSEARQYDEHNDKSSESQPKSTNSNDKSKPTIKKYKKNNKEVELLSFEDYKNTSNEDIRQVLEHLHGKQTW